MYCLPSALIGTHCWRSLHRTVESMGWLKRLAARRYRCHRVWILDYVNHCSDGNRSSPTYIKVAKSPDELVKDRSSSVSLVLKFFAVPFAAVACIRQEPNTPEKIYLNLLEGAFVRSSSELEHHGNRMQVFVTLVLSLIVLTVSAEDCTRVYSDRIEKLKSIDGAREAIMMFCDGRAHFKVLTGVEYLMLGVPERWKNRSISVEEIFYYDAIECDEQHEFLELQDTYVRAFNQQMVECLETGRRCCPRQSP